MFSFFFPLSLSMEPLMIMFFSFFFFLNFLFFLKKLSFSIFFFFFFFLIIFIYTMILFKETFFFGNSIIFKLDIYSFSFFLFILSEIMVFLSIFWSQIHNFYVFSFIFNGFWPPVGMFVANPSGLIIFGTSILLSSSLLILMTHMKFLFNFFSLFVLSFLLILFMGSFFLDIQFIELNNMVFKLSFSFFDSIYSNSFISVICLHSFHVFLGLMFLALIFSFCFFFSYNLNFYISLDMSIWYWHFVDYVWVFVFSLFYYFNN